jgi:hypothetical protein
MSGVWFERSRRCRARQCSGMTKQERVVNRARRRA